MALSTRTTAPLRTSGPTSRGPVGWVRRNIIVILGTLAFVYLLLPNVIVVIFSFNNPTGRFNYSWAKFSLDAWLHPCGAPGMCSALGLSLKIGVIATILATILGTLAAFALTRHRFRGRTLINLLIFMPMATPEVVMGSSLLTLFIGLRFPLGAWTIIIAHVMFCVSFVIVTVKARVAGLDPNLEEAAGDLYANPRQTFLRVTLPLVAPGIAAGALLAFSLSFDDYIITNFNAGSDVTFPMYIWGAAQRGTPVQINVIGTIMFLVALIAVAGGQIIGARRRRAAE